MAVSADPPDLRDAIRRARLEDAERGSAVVSLHEAEIARLEILQEALKPLLDQVPPEIDLFDHGLVPGETPRLYIDMLALVEMGRDKRAYRFVQDTRWGRRTIAESEAVEPIVRAVTDYVARRLVRRERALAAEDLAEEDRATTAASAAPVAASPPAAAPVAAAGTAPPAPPPAPSPPADTPSWPPGGRAGALAWMLLGIGISILAYLIVTAAQKGGLA